MTDHLTRLGKVQALGTIQHEDFVLEGRKLSAQITGAITSASLTRSIEEASQLTIVLDDPGRYLQRGGYYERRGDLLLDDLWFRLRAMDKDGDQFTLTFEDREVALLRRHTKPARAVRGKLTRAEFLKGLVQKYEPHIHFVCPELHTAIGIRGYSKADQQTIKRDRRRGIALDDTSLKVAGRTATREQRKIANRLLNVAQSKGAGKVAAEALVFAGIAESRLGDAAGTYRPNALGYYGILQGSHKVWPDPHDVEGMASAFLTGGRGFQAGGAIALAKTVQDPIEIAVRVEAPSVWPDNAYAREDGYPFFLPEARAAVEAYGGVDKGPASDGTETFTQQTIYTQGLPLGPKGEDIWAAGQRNAHVLGWRWFCVAGVVYLISDYDLIRSQPRITLNETSKGVDSIDFGLDYSTKRPSEVTIEGRAHRWAAPPGTVVNLDQSMGAASGAWIVSHIERPDLFDDAVTITLVKPEAPQLEPAPKIAERSASSSSKTTQDGGVNAGDIGGKTGKVTIAPGADRAGVSTQQHVIAFLKEVAGKTTEPIVITTGTNHNQMTTSGNVSDHWTGDAADLGVGGDARSSSAAASKGDNIATAALVVIGMDATVARQRATSGWCNFGGEDENGLHWVHDGKTYRVQVGWRTLVGGDHFNHVHIGVAPR